MSEVQDDKPVAEDTPELTMESILAEPGINPEPVKPVAAPVEPTPVQPSKPDVSGLINDLQELRAFKDQYQKEQVQQEIGTVVSKIQELSGIKNNDQCEYMLNKKYDSDPNFQKIYDGRYSNPKAFNQALDIIAKETAQTFGQVIDPNLAESQSALIDANVRSTSGGGQPTDPYLEQEKSLMSMSDDDFSKAMGSILRG